LEELGYKLEGEDLNDAFLRFKELADRKREIADRDLEAIVSEQVQQQGDGRFQLRSVQVSCGTGMRPTATVTLETAEGEERSEAAIGTGPVDAVCQALNRLAAVPNELVEFSVKSVTEGIDAMGEVTIRLRADGVLYSGHSADTDIVVAAAQAFINALNRLVAGGQRAPLHPQKTPLPLAETQAV
jgi:2-isopropylmalate synthase